MKVLKKWREDPAKLKEEGLTVDWFPATLKDCIDHTEGAGYWMPDTVKELLEKGQEVWNPFASYKKG